MAIDFNSLLSDEQKKAIISQKVEQFAVEAFQHTINKQVAEKIGDGEAVAAADAALATLEAAITEYQAALPADLEG